MIPLFGRWAWASDVQRSITNSQTEDEIDEFGGRIESLSDAIYFLKQPDDMHMFRTDFMMKQNATIFEKLALREPPQIRFVPSKNDRQYWETLEIMDLCWESLQYRFRGSPKKPPYEIWKFAKEFSLASRRPGNARTVVTHLITSPAFRSKFLIRNVTIESTAPGDIEVEIIGRDALLAPPRNIDPSDDESVMALLRYAFQMQVSRVDDPRRYVEFIPWEELTPVSDSELRAAHVQTSLRHEPGMDDHDQKWMLWPPPSRHFFDIHHLYTEFEVYDYCITRDWCFPGHFYHDAVVFALSPLQETDFLSQLMHFWDHWVCPRFHK